MTPTPTLVLDRSPGRIRLYLGGDLQFDTLDEAVYHERLAHPALGATRSRFDGPLDLLVLGGGDGLLARELLRHEGVGSVRVVDLNPEVVALARSDLRPFNGGSLDDPRVEVVVADARDALDSAGRFHAIFLDLTFPATLEDCALFTRDWFDRLRGHLHPGGLLALNAVSPERTASAFWCLYQTLRAAGLAALPGHFPLASFAELGYGEWGFLLASDRPIAPGEVLAGLPAGVTTLGLDGVAACFRFPGAWAGGRAGSRPGLDDGATLHRYLLDPPSPPPGGGEGGEPVDFLGLDDPDPPPAPGLPAVPDPRIRDWLGRPPGSGIDDLLAAVPIGHRMVTRDLIRHWASSLAGVLGSLDLERLVAALIRRGAALPRRLLAELRGFHRRLARGEDPAGAMAGWGHRFLSVLMLVIVLSQTAMPTTAYGKGGFGGGYVSSGYHSRSYRSSSRPGSPMDVETRRVIGGLLLGGGSLVAGFSAYKKAREGGP